MIRKRLINIISVALFVISIAGYLIWQNNAIQLSYFNYADSALPEPFHGFKVVQVSDLHNKDFGHQLINKVTDERPDIIVVTGDVIDRNRTDVPTAIKAMEKMVEIAPVYFVSGNHEVTSGEFEVLQSEMAKIGVVDLDNSHENLEINGSEIGLIGMEDPLLLLYDDIERVGSSERLLQSNIEKLVEESGADFTLLLSHRAELMEIYSETSVNMVLTGHAHGGQIRIPFVNGVYAPSQGFLPEYTSGLYQKNSTTMIVSRGLGNSIFPLRINNRPELVILTLEANQ
ncbi:MAG: metallophosphoesterase [Alkalibacterium sp.]|nr:metallophosphoesterase [Alkalibacterium sp.]